MMVLDALMLAAARAALARMRPREAGSLSRAARISTSSRTADDRPAQPDSVPGRGGGVRQEEVQARRRRPRARGRRGGRRRPRSGRRRTRRAGRGSDGVRARRSAAAASRWAGLGLGQPVPQPPPQLRLPAGLRGDTSTSPRAHPRTIAGRYSASRTNELGDVPDGREPPRAPAARRVRARQMHPPARAARAGPGVRRRARARRTARSGRHGSTWDGCPSRPRPRPRPARAGGPGRRDVRADAQPHQQALGQRPFDAPGPDGAASGVNRSVGGSAAPAERLRQAVGA